MRIIIFSFALALPLLPLACGGSDSTPAGDGDGDSSGDGDGDSSGDGDGDSSGDGDGDGDSVGDGDDASAQYFLDQIHLGVGLCLPRILPTDGQGQVSCTMLEASAGDASCLEAGRAEANPGWSAAVLAQLEGSGRCGGATSVACSSLTICEIPQLSGPQAAQCKSDPADSTTFDSVGYCYIDDPGSPLVSECSPSEARQVRAIGPDVPAIDSVVFFGCTGNAGAQGPSPEAAVGQSCAAWEESPTFAGHSTGEISFAGGTNVCGGGYCLAHNVRGRVGCPYGQREEALSLSADDPSRCLSPSGEPVTVPVEPQLIDRRADELVYCSCRCGGPDPSGDYCECPSGFACEPLVPDIGQGDLAGSYCVKEGASYDPGDPPTQECDGFSMNCE